MTYADHPQIFKFRQGLAEAVLSPASHIDKYSGVTVEPKEVARRGTRRIDSGTAGAKDLHDYRARVAALCGGVQTIQ